MKQYREYWGYSQKELCGIVNGNYGISLSELNKYETGARSAPPEFCYHLGVCLELDKEQQRALGDAWLLDATIEFWRRFNAEALSRAMGDANQALDDGPSFNE